MKRINNSLIVFAFLSHLTADAFLPNLLSQRRRRPSSVDAFDSINRLDDGSQKTEENGPSNIDNIDKGANNFFPSPTARSIQATSESYSLTDDDDELEDLYFVNIAKGQEKETNNYDQQSRPWRLLVSVEVSAKVKEEEEFEKDFEEHMVTKPVTINVLNKHHMKSTTTTRRSILDAEATSSSTGTGRSQLDDRMAINTAGRTANANTRTSSSSSPPKTTNSIKPGPQKLLSDEEMERTMINDDKRRPHKATGKPLVDENNIGQSSSPPPSSSAPKTINSIKPGPQKLLSDEEMERTTINDDKRRPHKATGKPKPLVDENNIGRSSSSSPPPPPPSSSALKTINFIKPGPQKLLSDEEMERTVINDDKRRPHEVTGKPLVDENNVGRSSPPPPSSPARRLQTDEIEPRKDNSPLSSLAQEKSPFSTSPKPNFSVGSSVENVESISVEKKSDRIPFNGISPSKTVPIPKAQATGSSPFTVPAASTFGIGSGSTPSQNKTTTTSDLVGNVGASFNVKKFESSNFSGFVSDNSKPQQLKTSEDVHVSGSPNSVPKISDSFGTNKKKSESPSFNGSAPTNVNQSNVLQPGESPFTPSQITTASTTSGSLGNTGASTDNEKQSIAPSSSRSSNKQNFPWSTEGSPFTASKNTTTAATTPDSFGKPGINNKDEKNSASRFPNFNGFGPSNSIPTSQTPGTSFQPPASDSSFGASGNSFQSPNTTIDTADENASVSTDKNTGASEDEKKPALSSFNGFTRSTGTTSSQAPEGSSFQAPTLIKPSSFGPFGASGGSFLSEKTTTDQSVGDISTPFNSSGAVEQIPAIPSFNGFPPSTSTTTPKAPEGPSFQAPDKLSSFGVSGSTFPSQTQGAGELPTFKSIGATYTNTNQTNSDSADEKEPAIPSFNGSTLPTGTTTPKKLPNDGSFSPQNQSTARVFGGTPTLLNSIGNTANSTDAKAPLSDLGAVSSMDNKPKNETPGSSPFGAPFNSPFGAGGKRTMPQNTNAAEEKVGTFPLNLDGKTNLDAGNRTISSPGANNFSSTNNGFKPEAPGGIPFAGPLKSPFDVDGNSTFPQDKTTTEAKVGNAAFPSNLNGKTDLNADKNTSRFPDVIESPSSDDKSTPGSIPLASPPSAATDENQESGVRSSNKPQTAENDVFSMSENKALFAGMMSTMALSSATTESAVEDADKITPDVSSPPFESTKISFGIQEKSMPTTPANVYESETSKTVDIAADSMENKKSGFFEQLLSPSSSEFREPRKSTEISPSSFMDSPKGATKTMETSASISPNYPNNGEFEQLTVAQQRVDELQAQVNDLEDKKEMANMNIQNIVPPGAIVENDESSQTVKGGVRVEGESIKAALARLKGEAQAKKAAGIQNPGRTPKGNEMNSDGTPPESMPNTGTPEAKSFELQIPAAQSEVRGEIQENVDVLKSEHQDSGNSRRSDKMTSDAPTTTDEFGNVKPVLQLGAAKGVQVILDWKQNTDGSIFGYIYNSVAFDNGTRILTTPCINVAKAGYLIETASGSQYLLDISGDVKPVLSLAASKAVKAMMKWKEENSHRSIEGYITGWKQNSDGSVFGDINTSDAFKDSTRLATTPCVGVRRVGYIIETESGGQYILE